MDPIVRRFCPSDLPEQADVLIIGGGITGASAARDAALRGLSTVLVERDDFASGTSSRSSKLIHGGPRYLQTYQFRMVHESVREREVMMRIAPHRTRAETRTCSADRKYSHAHPGQRALRRG